MVFFVLRLRDFYRNFRFVFVNEDLFEYVLDTNGILIDFFT